MDQLRKQGLDTDRWECVSMEINVDTRKIRIDTSYSFQLVEGVVLKAYQHGYNTRIEIADRRRVPAREVLELFYAVAGGMDGKEMVRKVDAMEDRVTRCEKASRLALNVATSVRDKERSPRKTPAKQDPLPGFRTGADILKERVAAGAGKRGKN
jgi:hypothetical protein